MRYRLPHDDLPHLCECNTGFLAWQEGTEYAWNSLQRNRKEREMEGTLRQILEGFLEAMQLVMAGCCQASGRMSQKARQVFTFLVGRVSLHACWPKQKPSLQALPTVRFFRSACKAALERRFREKSGRRDSNPRQPAWKAGTLPLSYSRVVSGCADFEPRTSWSQTRRATNCATPRRCPELYHAWMALSSPIALFFNCVGTAFFVLFCK